MDLKDVIQKRRAYRSLDSIEISNEIINELIEAAQLAPSCYNNQPWNYIFIRDITKRKEVYNYLSKTNKWIHNCSLIVAVFSEPELDCIIHDRTYYLFDSGLATAFLILRATELGLVAHPIAGFNEEGTKRVLGIPEKMRLITLVIVGKHSTDIKEELSEKQKEIEQRRPERKSLPQFAYLNNYNNPIRKRDEKT